MIILVRSLFQSIIYKILEPKSASLNAGGMKNQFKTLYHKTPNNESIGRWVTQNLKKRIRKKGLMVIANYFIIYSKFALEQKSINMFKITKIK